MRGALRLWVKGAEAVNGVAKEFCSEGGVLSCGPKVKDASADGKG